MTVISVPFYCIMHVLCNVVRLCNPAFVKGCQSQINVCLFVYNKTAPYAHPESASHVYVGPKIPPPTF